MDRRTSQKKQATISKQRKRKIQENKREQTKNAIFLVLPLRRHWGLHLGRGRGSAYPECITHIGAKRIGINKSCVVSHRGALRSAESLRVSRTIDWFIVCIFRHMWHVARPHGKTRALSPFRSAPLFFLPSLLSKIYGYGVAVV